MADKSPRNAQSEADALAFSGQLGKTIQRLRKAYNLSLSELSEQSGVAKSIISQIERNETNPTLATIWRLSQALDVSIDRVLSAAHDADFVEDIPPNDMPVLTSEDGKMQLTIIGWSKTVEWLQWYDVAAEAGAVLESEGHQRGSIECLSVLSGTFEVIAGQETRRVETGGTVRYRCDRPHTVRCLETAGCQKGRATMVCILKAAVME
ncbi:MAG: helix-turn-helix transcriptional regulator [Rhizobiales bacterium]|nr:helix-turn-helix transcriptional regulator [Hyphomicrobiales bacterium]MBO6697707.1 helix-turn-helix transcriptional regulator [Hyphomicrobiales bacterium]MBO6736038.1 helix-turn-helix transcriptional regulator [Hyphomicrobiales bacterium]MBO6912508.1 helix-turn-helix transcriptional regulator [Hyphomicrobiales bacterium]MBO6956349.1 helix-turn-helix transcriptional regulator [Hyphomicrobiales bacterium]